MNCPSCGNGMTVQAFEANFAGRVTLDICWPCNAIWFDPMESTQLSPGAVIELFRAIHAHRGGRDDSGGPRLFADRLPCPACSLPLTLVHDLQRGGPISYYRCGHGHGRLTSFFQFLREKQFVRTLNAVELAHLKTQVAQVRCSSCGAPVDLQHDSACSFCRAPISILDAGAVEKALNDLDARQQQRVTINPAALAEAVIQTQRDKYRIGNSAPRQMEVESAWVAGVAVDLVGDCLSALSNLFD